MKAMVVGVTRSHGKAKGTGNLYDMAFVNVLVPVEISGNENRSTEGYGYKVMEAALAPESIHSFKELKFPINLELVFENRPNRFGKGFDSVVVNYKLADKVA